MIARETVRADILAILDRLTGDWEFDGEIRESTSILLDMGLESIDAVVLGTEINEQYGVEFPFAHFLNQLEPEKRLDFTVGQLVDFVTGVLNAEGVGQGPVTGPVKQFSDAAWGLERR